MHTRARLRPVPHRGHPAARGARLRDDHRAGRLQHLPRRAGARARAEPPRPARRRRATPRPRPASTCHGEPTPPRAHRFPTLADLRAQRAGAVRPLPPPGRSRRGAARRGAARTSSRATSGRAPRQGPDRERSGGVGDLHRLPHRPPRARRRATPNSSVSRHNIADTCGKCHQRHRGEVQDQHPLAGQRGHQRARCPPARTATPRTPSAASTPRASGCAMMDQCGRCHEDVGGDLLRDLPRQGRRSSARRARPSATTATAPTTSCRSDNPESTLSHWNRGRDLRHSATPGAPAVRGLPDPRHPPRQGQVPVPVLLVLVHDDRCWWARCPFALLHTFAWLWRLLADPRPVAAPQGRPPRTASIAASPAPSGSCTW